MLKISEIQERLQQEPNLAEVARQLKVTRSYIWELSKGTKLNPSTELHERLSDYLEAK